MTTAPSRVHSHDVRNAWIALALFPLAYVVAALVGGAILAGLGYAEQEPVPLGTALAVGLPLAALIALPAAVGCWLGWRARRAGDDRGSWPAALGGALFAFILLTNLAGLLAR